MDDPLSQKALAGAVATGLSLCALAMLVPTWTMPVMRVSYGPTDPPPASAPAFLMTLVISAGLALGLPALLSGTLFRAAASWTRGGACAGAPSRRDWWAIGLGVVALAVAGVQAGPRLRRDRGSVAVMPASVVGDFTVDGGTARVEVNDAMQTTEWTRERPAQVQRLTLNVAATLAEKALLVCEVRHTLPDGREATVRRLDDAVFLTGELVGGSMTVHRNFQIELPEGAGSGALQEAHGQVNGGWRHRRRSNIFSSTNAAPA